MKKPEGEIMTSKQVAELLQLHQKTIYALAEHGKIPGHRVGRSWRFVRTQIMEYLGESNGKEK